MTEAFEAENKVMTNSYTNWPDNKKNRTKFDSIDDLDRHLAYLNLGAAKQVPPGDRGDMLDSGNMSGDGGSMRESDAVAERRGGAGRKAMASLDDVGALIENEKIMHHEVQMM